MGLSVVEDLSGRIRDVSTMSTQQKLSAMQQKLEAVENQARNGTDVAATQHKLLAMQQKLETSENRPRHEAGKSEIDGRVGQLEAQVSNLSMDVSRAASGAVMVELAHRLEKVEGQVKA